MGATFTMYGRQQMLKAYWQSAAVVLASSQMALVTSVPPSNAAASQLVEPSSADGYARITCPMTTAFWGESGFSEIYNLQAMVFPEVEDDWGLIQGWAIVAVAAGQCLAVGGLAEPFDAVTGMIPTIEIQGITLGLYD